jgi:hypothetical protein
MRKYIPLLYPALLIATSATAQQKDTLQWKEKPQSHSVPAEYAGESSVVIDDNVQLEYKDENKELVQYITVHRIVKVLDEKGVETFNKMNIPFYTGQKVETLKARTILPNGKVIDVSKDKMKETKNEDGSNQISFAMDGVEKNAEVEYLIRYKKDAALFGKETFQYSIPVLHTSFEILSPKRVKFEEKGYNGFPTVTDTLIGDTRHIYAESSKLPVIRSEGYSFSDIYASRAEYKVSYLPEEKGTVRMFTWQDMVNRLYSQYYQFSERETKAVEKYLETIGVSENDKEEDKIRKIESAIKSGITQYKEINDENAYKLDYIISKKAATQAGIIKLFAACFTQTAVRHELGVTTNRRLRPLDEEFENWNSLENYLFYFPTQKKFLSPEDAYYRYPFTSTDVLTNKGLFCTLTTLGDVTKALAKTRTIPYVPLSESENNITANISFTTDMEATADVSYTFTGYTAMGLREYFVLLPKEKVKELVQNMAHLADKPENLVKYTVSGEAFDNYYTNKPLQIAASVKAPQLVEKAGAKFMFRIGDVIGKQSELYQEDERKLPIDLAYPHSLNRTITVNIPDGYTVLNPETIKINAEYKNEKDKVTTAFHSDYKIENNKLVVTINEFYDQLHFPATAYEPFRKVINAAADFNKVTLLLGKEGK